MRKLLGALPRVARRLSDHLRLQAVELGEGVRDARPRQLNTVAQQLGLARVSGAGTHHVVGPELDRAADGQALRPDRVPILALRLLASERNVAVGDLLGPEAGALEEGADRAGLLVDRLL